MSDKVTLSREELREVVTEGVTEAFKQLGIDADEPLETQRDMAHLRKWRVAVDQTTSAGFKTATGTIILGALGALWLGIKTLMNQP